MDTESLIFALLLIAGVGLGYRVLRNRKDTGNTPPEHFFGGMDDETVLHESRGNRHKD